MDQITYWVNDNVTGKEEQITKTYNYDTSTMFVDYCGEIKEYPISGDMAIKENIINSVRSIKRNNRKFKGVLYNSTLSDIKNNVFSKCNHIDWSYAFNYTQVVFSFVLSDYIFKKYDTDGRIEFEFND